MANDFKDAIVLTNESLHKINSPPTKKIKEDPFAAMRGARNSISSITFSANSFTNDIEQDIQIYENTIYEVPEDNNPLIFWRDQQQSLPILSKIAKSVFVIQASSAESERHFSMAGQIVTERRSQLDPEYVEALVVLK